ncbi:hypothetical protein R1sor_014705 [Riccia sorocarpa]|uniref:Uncharacterized protein n=1 Tax=Riccia sorocarpa TaxID=122646 RepID=A0ABD3HC10_9MARC
MRHAWFRWFVHETDLVVCRRLFWTPGTEVGRERFRGKLIELGIEAYTKLIIDPNSGFDTTSVEVEDRLRTLVLGVPGKFAENYDMWLQIPQFDKWTLLKEAYPYSSVWVLRTKESVQQTFRKRAEIWDGCSLGWTVPPNAAMVVQGIVSWSVYVDHGLAKTLGAHDVVFYVVKRMLTIDRWRISGHAEAVREMSAFPISHPAICAPVGGILDDESPTLLFPWWNGGQISHWITRERELRWTRTANGLRREPPSEDVMARYDTDTHLSVEIFRKHM